MKIKIYLSVVLGIALLFLSGCGSNSSKFVPYSFVEEDQQINAALVNFERNIRLIDFDGIELPQGQYWPSVRLPAGRAMNLRVYIYWEADFPGTRRRGIFKCPPLETGAEYNLSFNYKSNGIFIKRPRDGYSIVLSKKVSEDKVFKARYDRVITQVLPKMPD